ncbi:zinc ribbon domain-containing protein [Acidobacteria bacterium AH-259-A15]|nr:zinc ribbon domain-containing protein [Acidobacteria bacterium AH-259-A15]
MPIWEYCCSKCEKQFEKILWRDSETVECPNCGNREVEKMLSTFAVATAPSKRFAEETGPCPCGAPRRGMCATE